MSQDCQGHLQVNDTDFDLIEAARHNALVLGALLGFDTPAHQIRYFKAHRENQNCMILSPADHGKTTLFGMLVPLQAMLENPDIRIGYITANSTIAESILRGITTTLGSPEFCEMFGDLRPRNPSRWTMNEIVINRTKTLKDPTIFCSGMKGKIINRRFDGLILDDICDPENMYTPESRAKLRTNLYNTIMPCLEPNGWIQCIGSRQHYDDIYGDFIKNPIWNCIVDECVDSTTGEPIWPEHWSKEALARRKQEIGEAAFAMRYHNRINPEGESYFPPEWLEACRALEMVLPLERNDLPEELKKPNIQIVQAIDLASGTTRKASKFAHITAAVEFGADWCPKITPLSVYRGSLPYPKQKEMIVSQYQRWLPSRVLVESNGVQQLIVQDFSDALGFNSDVVEGIQTGREKNSVEVGIPYLSSLVKNQFLQLPWGDQQSQRDMTPLVDEMVEWPKSRSTDLLMALWFIVKWARWKSRMPAPQENFNMVCPRRHYPLSRFSPRRRYYGNRSSGGSGAIGVGVEFK